MIKDIEKRRAYQRQWMAKRRAEYFDGKVCAKCGATTRLELDHIDRDTKVTHRIWSWAKERREAELKKCQVLCYDCHEEKTTAWRKSLPYICGTMNGYSRGCRCEVCKLVRNEWRRARYRKSVVWAT